MHCYFCYNKLKKRFFGFSLLDQLHDMDVYFCSLSCYTSFRLIHPSYSSNKEKIKEMKLRTKYKKRYKQKIS